MKQNPKTNPPTYRQGARSNTPWPLVPWAIQDQAYYSTTVQVSDCTNTARESTPVWTKVMVGTGVRKLMHTRVYSIQDLQPLSLPGSEEAMQLLK